MRCQDDLVALGDLGSSWTFELVGLGWLDGLDAVYAVYTIKGTASGADDRNLCMSSRIGILNNVGCLDIHRKALCTVYSFVSRTKRSRTTRKEALENSVDLRGRERTMKRRTSLWQK